MNPLLVEAVRSAGADAYPLCSVDDVPFGEGRSITVEGVKIGVFNTAAGFFAIQNECPHEGGPLSDGLLAEACVTCPLHGWRINLRNGRVEGREDRVSTFRLHQDGHTLWIDAVDLERFSG
ncbi:MAG: Rieske 2Fe-2S domain-containing protein [Actinobacteria bacterium]|nr:Rieske 2Fe-2S domain-containing protein [Actinomycetota bacterium]